MPSLIQYLGIDPGQGGGLVILRGSKTIVSKMPPTRLDLFNWLIEHCNNRQTVAVIEEVSAMPGQGVTSMFKFGMNFERVCMACTAALIPFELIRPLQWQKALGIKKRSKKEPPRDHKRRLYTTAQQLFPKERVIMATADAFLIAEYCRRKHKGTL